MLQHKTRFTKNGDSPDVQAKLKIGQPGDKYEQEAHGVADKVMSAGPAETMQLQPMEEEEEMMQPKLRMQPMAEEEEEPLQMKRNDGLLDKIQSNMESSFGTDFSAVKIHKNSGRADKLNARAFTQGEQIHFAPGEFNPNTHKGRNLIGHEFTHVVQQRSGVVKPTAVKSKGLNINDDTWLEHEADRFGEKAVKGEHIPQYRSAGLDVRNSLRSTVQAKGNVIQRDIKGKSSSLTYGEMELNFTKNDAAAKGVNATETGTVKFTPNKTAPNSNSIRLIQIVRTTDVAGTTSSKAGEPIDWSKDGSGAEADRNKMMTAQNRSKNTAGGFYVDHLAASTSATPRTKKSDAVVTPYYRDYAPNAGSSQDGHKKSAADIKHASLWDGPGTYMPVKFNFVTSAKGADTGTWYGTALWGFETYLDKGIVKIKGEYKSFRNQRGETMDAAVEKFNEFYQNPGTSKAPTK